MRLDCMALYDFRNYEHAEVELSPVINVFFGRNAQGKTNLLEAIYLMAIGRSFRTANEREIARYGKDSFRLGGRFLGADGLLLSIEYLYCAEGKSVRANGIILRRANDIFGRVRVVLFSPDDLLLLKGGPEHRRAYIDLYLAQVRPAYRYTLLNLQRLLTQRNEILKRIRDGFADRDQLAVWNETLSRLASEVVKKRLEALATLGPMITKHHHALSAGNEEILLRYRLGGDEVASLHLDLMEYYREQLAKKEREEIARGLTLIGPQRDEIEIGFSSGHGLRTFGSQGQQRTAALAMKLAAVDYLQVNTGEYPILLLDDVLSEFDEVRQSMLLGILLGRSQTIITATGGRDAFARIPSFRSFHVEAGRIMMEAE